MNGVRTAIRGVLDRARRCRAHLPDLGRWSLAVAILATLLAPTLAPSTPVAAAGPIIRDHRDPYARILLVIKKIIVHDDSDLGDGEIAIGFSVCSAYAGGSCDTELLKGGIPEFSASDGTVKVVDRVIPAYGDTMNDGAITPPFGIPLREGVQYEFLVVGAERDSAIDDKLGYLRAPITDKDGHIRFGTHTEQGLRNYCQVLPPDCGTASAKFSVEYEIRHATLPDLRPVNIKIYDLPGNPKKLVCAGIQNVEAQDAGAFDVTLKIDGVVPPGGKATAGRLASGDYGELCSELALPTTGQHTLSAVVDEADGVLEYNETDNVFEQAYTAPKQTTAPEPEATPTPKPVATPVATQADLTISAINVNGQVPDGKDDCKQDKSAVTVVVKNIGAATGDATVRLVVDDAQGAALEQAVAEVEAGKEREVRFGEVRLKKGQHKLTAIVDPKGTLDESNDDNNSRTVTVSCRDDG